MNTPVIAIIGAGPCGLTLARLFECKGIDYVVYERDESPESNRNGGSLDIHGDTGQLALRECGLFDKFMQRARYEDTVFAIADKAGERLLELGQGRDAPEIDRTDLRQILLDSIPEDKIKWGHALKSATPGNDKSPVLRFANDTEFSGFKLIVGADGAWSKVRPMVTRATPMYTGKSFIVSTIHHANPLYETIASKVKAGSSLSIGCGKYIMIQRQGDGSYRISFGLQAPEGFFRNGSVDLQDTEATRRVLLLQFYADWSDEYKDLVRYSTDFCAWPLYSLSPEDMGWESMQGVTLAGDAAHLAYPGGEGVNVAMTDSLKLASKIAEHGVNHIAQAVQEYEADMFSRAIDAITESKAMENVMYSENPQAFVDHICA
ncbi:FAD/NAD(P)-binding domain-containing protein [Coniochaeta ligniaria NRRL 30616]|uniref:FAD/NAD(P)-binding domain-containing protein n=1 Tax=Coniochaeta ligniaria NRRL 30616 TaxID=1408157 RepID=A0A1J7JAX8_9PEZI|nr:FAD/NAD(P)-binding domain-containing protein [Coniochaeta ligniaria NRRL 30616]